MKITGRGIEIIKAAESCRLEAYVCPAGVLTIGYGHTGPDVTDGMTITQADADALLKVDLLKFDTAVSSICPASTPLQHSAMVSLCYNVGIAAFRKSSVARLHKAGKYAEAAQAFALWNKSKGKVLGGLVKRRAQEASLYIEGIAPDDTPLIVDEPTQAEGEKSLSKSKTVIGSTVAAASMGASQIGEIATQVSWIKDLIQPLLPYMPQISAGLLIVGCVGIMVALYARYKDRRDGRA